MNTTRPTSQSINNKGFTAINLPLSLSVLMGMLMIIVHFNYGSIRQVNGFSAAEQAVDYSRAANRYITTHYSLLQELLSINDNSNGLVATVPLSILKEEGFINNVYPIKNLLRQYPCLVITYGNHQVQGFLYYREDKNSKTLAPDQLHAGLEHVGGMIGLYNRDGAVSGAGNGWSLTSQETKKLFIATGNADPSQGQNTAAYQCNGDTVANNSFVVSLASILTLENKLPKDDSLHQYQDTLTNIDDPENSNTMKTDLIMDYKSPLNPQERKQSNIIFQMNENCTMDPSQPATMQDYDARYDGTRLEYQNKPNNLGCRNRQLGITESEDADGNAIMTITGFKQGGDTAEYDLYNKNNPNKYKSRPYVGNLSAAFIQPTAQVAVGTPCTSLEIGKMAQQKQSMDPNDVNILYTSQVQCMKHPLCPITTSGVCYMSISTVSIQINTPQNSYNPIQANCPVGTFVSDISADSSAIKPTPCCGANTGIGFCCHIDDCTKGGGSCSKIEYITPLSGYSNYNIPLFQGIQTTPSRWYQGCPTVHSDCNEGWGQNPDTYIIVRSITCTNDISQISIPIQQ